MASRVLVLTIDGQAADDVVDLLQRRGLAVTVGHDPASALRTIGLHQVIILDARDGPSLAMLCRRINDEAGSAHPPILAIAHSGDVEARVQLLEAGADDVLARPVDERELEALVEALLLRAPSPGRTAGSVTSVPTRPAGAPGKVIAFGSAKGGSGTTTLAVNTALILAEMAPGSVAIADFDMYHGQVSTHLDLYPRSSTAAMAREDPQNLTAEAIADAGRPHASGLTVFGGPYRPDDGAAVTAPQLIGLAEQLRTLYGTVVLDVGSTLDMRSMAVLQRADRIAFVLTPDIPALRLLHASLQVLSEQGQAADRAIFIVNHIFSRPMIGPDQIEEHLGIKVGLEVPYDGDNFMKAVNEGQPLVNVAHRSPATAALRRLAGHMVDAGDEPSRPTPQKRGLFRGLLGRD